MAYASFRATKIRSLLTIVGISIGVASIVLVHGLGSGAQANIVDGIRQPSDDVITVASGKLINKTGAGTPLNIDLSALIGASTLTEKDVTALRLVDGVTAVAPIGVVAGLVQTETTKNSTGAIVVASTPEIRIILNKEIKFGNFWGAEDTNRNLAVIGSKAARTLFQEESPIGRMLTFRGVEFIVKGVFEEFEKSNSSLAINYNNAVVIPLETAKRISGGVLEIREIQVKITGTENLDTLTQSINTILLEEHRNQEDFSLYKPGEYAALTNQIFSYITTFITAIAGISLFVGGVGIMNIMFVSVTERTKEIGVRKALGATSRQILGQFLAESIILSTIGGFIGIFVAAGAGYAISIRTSLTPAFSIVPISLTLVLSILIGTLFGIAPAVKASRQDPIKSLRHH